ncbi:MAG: NUDIX hydrolase [Pseudomonadota bacterium]
MDPRPRIKTGVGAVVFRGDEVLLIRRAKPPFKDHWSIPGGGLEFGERLEDAVAREVMEETGCTIVVEGLVHVFESLPPDHGNPDAHYVMIDYLARWTGGEPRAGDDAADAQFFFFEEGAARVAWDETRTVLHRAKAMAERLGLAAKTG